MRRAEFLCLGFHNIYRLIIFFATFYFCVTAIAISNIFVISVKVGDGIENGKFCSYVTEYFELLESARPKVIQCDRMRSRADYYRLVVESSVDFSVFSRAIEPLIKNGFVSWFEVSGKMQSQSLPVSSSLVVDDYYNSWADKESFGSESIKNSGEFVALKNFTDIYSEKKPVTIAVLDSGVDFSASGLESLRWSNFGEVADNGLDDDANGFVDDVAGWDFVEDTGAMDKDPMRHGTAVALIIDQMLPDAFKKNFAIMPLRVVNPASGGEVDPFDLADAIYYAVDKKVNVINLSLGSTVDYQIVAEAVASAVSSGVVIVAAAGNTSGLTMFPARLEGVISIGAKTKSGAILSSSARGPGVDAFFLGENVLDDLKINFPVRIQSGTSFAAPLATAIVAQIAASIPESNPCDLVLRKITSMAPETMKSFDLVTKWFYSYENDFHQKIIDGRNWANRENLCAVPVSLPLIIRNELTQSFKSVQ